MSSRTASASQHRVGPNPRVQSRAERKGRKPQKSVAFPLHSAPHTPPPCVPASSPGRGQPSAQTVQPESPCPLPSHPPTPQSTEQSATPDAASVVRLPCGKHQVTAPHHVLSTLLSLQAPLSLSTQYTCNHRYIGHTYEQAR